jgi:hypothetical protein
METKESHYVHKGEVAVLTETGQPSAVVSVTKDYVAVLAPVVATKNQAAVDQMVREGKAFLIPNGTRVKVVSESYNERQIQVLDGPLQGRTAWVPFEWLKPYASN